MTVTGAEGVGDDAVTGLPWFRVYTEIVDDPKMGRLTGGEFRTWIYLLALAQIGRAHV